MRWKLLITIAGCVFLSGPHTVSAILDGRIIRGSLAKSNQYPFAVHIKSSDNDGWIICCGSIISDTFILTAAHCTTRVKTIKVYMGSVTLKTSNKIYIQDLTTNVINHPDYDEKKRLNDISLIRIPKIKKFTELISPVRLPYISDMTSHVGCEPIIMGWGQEKIGLLNMSPNLKFGRVIVKANSYCEVFDSPILQSHICVSSCYGFINGNGDSGGPLVIQTDFGYYEQIGLMSVGDDMSEKICLAVFTRVSSYLQWIKEKTGVYYEKRIATKTNLFNKKETNET